MGNPRFHLGIQSKVSRTNPSIIDKVDSGSATKVLAPKYTPMKHPNTKTVAIDQRMCSQKK